MRETSTGWGWWAGHDEEWMHFGPCDSKEEAIEAARIDACGEFLDERGIWMVGVHFCEARNDPLKLSAWIDVEQMIDQAEDSLSDSDRVASEHDDGPFFEYPGGLVADFEARIKHACDDWQTAHGLTFTCRSFSHTRNQGFISVEHPNRDQKGGEE